MEAAIGTFSVFLFVLAVIIAVLALLLPVFVYQIRNRTLDMDKKLGVIIELLGGQKGEGASVSKIKTCPFCGAKNRPADHICIQCGKAMGI